MKYIGEKSLSSFISRALVAVWWFLLIAASCFVAVLAVKLLGIDPGDAFGKVVNVFNMDEFHNNVFLWFNWGQVIDWPVIAKGVIILFWAACAVLNLTIIWKARQLFKNFRKDIVFTEGNVRIIATVSVLMICNSIVTWSLGTLVTSIFLLVLSRIFQRGATLQEESDLTV